MRQRGCYVCGGWRDEGRSWQHWPGLAPLVKAGRFVKFPFARARTVAMIAVATSLFAGCAVVKINHDATDTVEHSGGEEVGAQLANRACTKVGAVRAEVISTVKKDDAKQEDSEKPDSGRSVTSFRCIY